MVILLFFAGTLFWLVNDHAQSITLYLAIAPLLLMDLYLHKRTEKSLNVLRSHIQETALVTRGGLKTEVSTFDIVPGDLLHVKSGNVLAADGIFTEAQELLIDESMLTGESLPVSKYVHGLLDPAKETLTVMPAVLGFAGTRVLRGEGLIRVLETGRQTEYGEIVEALGQIPADKTPLQKQIERLVRDLVVLGVLACIVLAIVRIYQGHGWFDAILSAATLAVAAMPEEFPVVFSFFLGVGVYSQKKCPGAKICYR
jgi:Ca2+-transporting ATPase